MAITRKIDLNIDIKKANQNTARELKNYTGVLGKLGSAAKSMIVPLTAAVGAIAGMGYAAISAAKRIKDLIFESLKLNSIQKASEASLQGSLNINKNLKESLDEYKKYASELQKTTAEGDEDILRIMATIAEFGEVSDEQLKKATEATIHYALKNKKSFDEIALLIGRASAGQTQMLSRMGIEYEKTGDKVKDFNEIVAIFAKRGDEFAYKIRNNFDRQLKALGNRIGDNKEVLGDLAQESGAVSSVFEILNKHLTDFEKWFSKKETKEDIKKFFKDLAFSISVVATSLNLLIKSLKSIASFLNSNKWLFKFAYPGAAVPAVVMSNIGFVSNQITKNQNEMGKQGAYYNRNDLAMNGS